MAITKQKKEEVVQNLVDKLTSAKSVVFTDYRGLTVEELNEVRNELRKEGIEYKVIKNTLFKIAAKEANMNWSLNLLRDIRLQLLLAIKTRLYRQKL
jgi:ribosomal protein L10